MLLIIVGPMAVGKHSVLQEIVKAREDLKGFPNHLTVQLARVLFPAGVARTVVSRNIRKDLILEATLEGISVVTTLEWAGEEDDLYIRQLTGQFGLPGEKFVVHLTSHPDELRRRVTHPDRLLHGKPSTVEVLERRPSLRVAQVASREADLVINTTKKSVAEVAAKILEVLPQS